MEKLGSDRVSVVGGGLVVESSADMPGWEVRAFRRAAIVYRGSRYFVKAKERSGGGLRYTLEPWEDERSDIDGGSIEYDESYVAARDSARRARAAAIVIRTLLLMLYPLLGFLPSAVKRRLADSFGISEERTTALSLVLEAAVALMTMAMMTISSFGNLYGGALGVDSIPGLEKVGRVGMVSLVLLVPDVVMRYTKILGESPHSYGFWEWLFRRER